MIRVGTIVKSKIVNKSWIVIDLQVEFNVAGYMKVFAKIRDLTTLEIIDRWIIDEDCGKLIDDGMFIIDNAND